MSEFMQKVEQNGTMLGTLKEIHLSPLIVGKIICSDLTFVNRGFTCRIEVESISGITAYKRRPP